MFLLDGFVYALTLLIALLLCTGGVHYASPTLKLELSQIDAFAIALLGLLCIRRLAWHRWLPGRIERGFAVTLQVFSRFPLATVLIAFALYCFLMTWNSVWRFNSFHALAFDLGFVDQSLWASTRVGFLHSSLSKGHTYLGEHFSPILGLLALLYRVFDSTYFLFLLQALVLGAPVLLVYALALEKRLPRPVAVLTALCYLMYQPLRAANNFDFREDNLFIGIFLGALLALEKKQLTLFWALCVTSWTVKENAPIFTGMIGAWLIVESLRGRMAAPRRWHGLCLGILSMVVFFIINTKITPHFVGTGVGADTMLVKRLRRFGNTNNEIFAVIFAHPFAFVGEVVRPFFSYRAVRYFLDVAAPFIVFSPAAPLVALIALAGISMNLLLNQPMIGFHYECILIPFLFYVLIAGLSELNTKNKLSGVRVPALVLLSFLVFFGRSPIDSIRGFQPNAHQRWVNEELQKLPVNASVATQSALHPHIDHRKDAYLFSAGVPATDYIIADLSPGIDLYATPNLAADVGRIDPLLYSLELERDNLRIWHRR